MKNICFTIHNVACHGGTERVGLLIANELCKRGFNVFFMSYDAKEGPSFSCDARIKCFSMLSNILERRTRKWQRYAIWKYHRFLIKHKIDLVIDIDTQHANWSIPAAMGTKTKVIGWDHFNYTYSTQNSFRKHAIKLIEYHAAGLVLLTKKDKNTYLTKTDVPSSIIHQIYNPITFEEQNWIKHENKRVIAIGRIDPQKGFDLLLKSWKIVEEQISDWTLEIVCGYGSPECLQKEAVSMGLKHIECTERTDNVRQKYLNASIYALSSRFEGFPMVLLEACALSLPMVAYDCETGPSEIVEDGINGFLVKPENVEMFAAKLIEMIENERLRLAMSKAAFETSKKFKIDNIMEQWINLINSL